MGRIHDVVKLVKFISVGSRGDTSPSLWNGHTKVNAALIKGIWIWIFCLLSKDCKLCSIFSCTNSLMFWLVSSPSRAKYDVKVY